MKKNLLLAITSAFLLWLAWPPIPFTSLVLLIAFVPLFIGVEDIIQSDYVKKGRKVFWFCALAFFIWDAASTYWLFNSLRSVMPAWTAVLVSILPFGFFTLLVTTVFWLYYRLRRITTRTWSYLGLISFWIGYEYLHQNLDVAFPWMTLGNGFAQTHQLIQWYEYTGVYGGTLWILSANILAFEIYRTILVKPVDVEINPDKKIKLIISFVAIACIPILVSLLMYTHHKEKEDRANVVVVQPNIDPYAKFGSMPSSAQIQQLIRLSDSVGQSNTEYFIWPETAIPENTNEAEIRTDPEFLSVQQFLSKYKNGNVLSGISTYSIYDSAKTETANYDENSKQYFDNFNAAIQIENSPKVQFYHKSKLVPGVEQIPFASALAFMKPVFAGFGGSSGGYGKQKEASVFYSQNGIGTAPVICYESIWGAYVASYVEKGAQFIAIITNDAWWGNTSGKDQHLQYAKLRAIETRRWVARSANTGISAFINQRGDIVKQSQWWAPTALKADINLNKELTFYTKHGDYIAWAGCLASSIFSLFLLMSQFKRKSK